MRQSWLLIVLGLLLLGGAAYIALADSHLDIAMGFSGDTVARIRVNCGSPLFRRFPLPAGLDYTGKGPCAASSSKFFRELIGAGLATAAGLGSLALGVTGLVRRPNPASA